MLPLWPPPPRLLHSQFQIIFREWGMGDGGTGHGDETMRNVGCGFCGSSHRKRAPRDDTTAMIRSSLAFAVLHLGLFAVLTGEDSGPKSGARQELERGGFARTLSVGSPATVHVDGSDAIRGLKFQALLDLIEEFSNAIDLEVDRTLYESTTERFSSLLNDYMQQYNSHKNIDVQLTFDLDRRKVESDLGHLLHKALLGAFSLRMNSIKDWLRGSRDEELSVEPCHRENIANWSLTLVKAILHFYSPTTESAGIHTSLKLAVKLQLIEAMELILQRVTTVNSGTKQCNLQFIDALQCAIISQNLPSILILISAHVAELETTLTDVQGRPAAICRCLTREGSEMPLSPWAIADLQCTMGLSCEAAQYLWSVVNTDCRPYAVSEASSSYVPTASNAGKDRFLSKVQKILLSSPTQTCSACCPEHRCNKVVGGGTGEWRHRDGNPKHTWLPRPLADLSPGAQRSGWAVYSNNLLGRDQCDLPRVKASSLSAEDFNSIFVNLR